MSFFETPKRRYHVLMAGGLVVVAAVIFGLPFAVPLDTRGAAFLLFVGVLFALGAAYHIWRARTARPDEVLVPLQYAPPRVQLRYVRLVLITTPPAFAGLTAFTAYDLRQLDTGKVQSVDVWLPLGFIYDVWGYWPTVLSVPILGLFVIALLFRRIRHLEFRARTREPDCEATN